MEETGPLARNLTRGYLIDSDCINLPYNATPIMRIHANLQWVRVANINRSFNLWIIGCKFMNYFVFMIQKHPAIDKPKFGTE
jgi:hypothetical protein